MCKKLKSNELQRGARRSLLAVSLIATLAVFGCTTNWMEGNGKPGSGGSYGPTTPSSSPGMGTSSGTSSVPPSMTSSSTLSTTGDSALAIMAAHQQTQPRILGPVSGDSVGPVIIAAQPTGQFNNPSMYVNPQRTVNATISSGPTSVVASGADGGTATDLGSAAIIDSAIATATPATASATLTPGAFAAGPGVATSSLTTSTGTTTTSAGNNGTLTPTVSSGATVTPTMATSPLVISNATTTSSTTSSASRLRSVTVGGATRTTASGSGQIAPVRIVRSANGSITVTNVNH